jgi:nucleotide sugar dehydrogenase
MAKKIAVIGTGYVGLIASVGFADFGNYVCGVDLDEDKVSKLNIGEPTIYEPGIEEYLKRNLSNGRLKFTTDISTAIRENEIIFIAVGTPAMENGDVELIQIENVIRSIADNINGYKVIVTKSTVPVGTNKWIKEYISEFTNENFDVVSNPEFLREGRAVYDFFHPDRVVIGYESEKAKMILQHIYRTLYITETPFVWCNIETAELIKYASNSFLAMKITFINQMANLSEKIGADINIVSKAIGMDGRIGKKFLHPGPGYGGSCFPKDTKAIVNIAEKYNSDMSLIKEVISSNEKQKELMVHKLSNLLNDLEDKKICILGAAFKNETDDVRDSPALKIIDLLLNEGAIVNVHDPKALKNLRDIFINRVDYFNEQMEAVKGVDAIVIITEWNEYRNLDLQKIKKIMKGNVILDTRNILNIEEVKRLGFIYEGVGRK